ncbi:MAG: hypothetical protein ACLQKA_03780 [Bryobacteraceae bacterium]
MRVLIVEDEDKMAEALRDGLETDLYSVSVSRIGAGFLTDSRLFDRFGDGFTLRQLITDSGRTSNLVASPRLEAGAADGPIRPPSMTCWSALIRLISKVSIRNRW